MLNDVVEDLRAIKWASALATFFLYCWIIALVVATAFWTLEPNRSYLTYWYTACKPDGSFSVYSNSYDTWGLSGFFQITTGFGKLTFTQAKVIDIIWDVVSSLPSTV